MTACHSGPWGFTPLVPCLQLGGSHLGIVTNDGVGMAAVLAGSGSFQVEAYFHRRQWATAEFHGSFQPSVGQCDEPVLLCRTQPGVVVFHGAYCIRSASVQGGMASL